MQWVGHNIYTRRDPLQLWVPGRTGVTAINAPRGPTGKEIPFPKTSPPNTPSLLAWQQQTPKDKGALKKRSRFLE